MSSPAFGRPKQVGEDFIVKASRRGGVDALRMRRAFVCERKQLDDEALILLLRVSPEDRRAVLKMESDVKGHVRKNIYRWFKGSVAENVIDEYFLHNVVVDETHGLVFRVRVPLPVVEGPANGIVAGRAYDLDLRIHWLRFRPTTYQAEFAVTSVEPRDVCAIVSDDETHNDDDDAYIVPQDALETIYDDLRKRLLAERDRIEAFRGRLARIDDDMIRTRPDDVADALEEFTKAVAA